MRIRPSTIAVGAAVVLVFSGLWVALRSLGDMERTSREADAQALAADVSTFLQVRTSALNALHGIFLDWTEPPSDERFELVVESLRESLVDFRRVWVTDSAGVMLHQATLEPGAREHLPNGTDTDTLDNAVGRLVAQVRRLRRPGITPPVALFGQEPAFVVAQPVIIGGELRGVVGGSVPLAALRRVVRDDAAPTPRARVVILTSHPGRARTTDTVLVETLRALRPGSGRHAVAPVALPGGGRWHLGVSYPEWSQVRLELWGVAFAALLGLVAGAWHERRQSRRIADRSRELEHLSQELLEANRAKSEFLANVSHELRTPLNAIVGFTELLRDGVYGELSPRQAGPVARIEASAAHLRQLVDQVLDLAKITAGRLEVQHETVDLRQVVLDVGTEMEPLFAERGLAFSLAVGPSVPRVRTDPVHLRQILVNLLGNAVKFTEVGSVTVRTRFVPADGDGGRRRTTPVDGTLRISPPDAQRAWVALQVADTGLGIAATDHERIFDEFEQVNPGSRGDSDRRGTGLGLPISRRLARLLGGELTVESQPGRGSVFTVWLPVER